MTNSAIAEQLLKPYFVDLYDIDAKILRRNGRLVGSLTHIPEQSRSNRRFLSGSLSMCGTEPILISVPGILCPTVLEHRSSGSENL
jgi:hypothetical protein